MDDLYRIEYGYWVIGGDLDFRVLNASPFGLPKAEAAKLVDFANAALTPSPNSGFYRMTKLPAQPLMERLAAKAEDFENWRRLAEEEEFKARVARQDREFEAEMKKAKGRIGEVAEAAKALDSSWGKLCDGPMPMSSRYHQPAFHSTDQTDALGFEKPPYRWGGCPWREICGYITPKAAAPEPVKVEPKVEPKVGQVWRRVKRGSYYFGQEFTVRRVARKGVSFVSLKGKRGSVWTDENRVHHHWEFVRGAEEPSVYTWLGGAEGA